MARGRMERASGVCATQGVHLQIAGQGVRWGEQAAHAVQQCRRTVRQYGSRGGFRGSHFKSDVTGAVSSSAALLSICMAGAEGAHASVACQGCPPWCGCGCARL